ncbi:MAG: hypothetical protein HY796_08725 [Elusimicrobia bacterium]|nr:hypothetical protein [Elusimicrobiota bacterium]
MRILQSSIAFLGLFFIGTGVPGAADAAAAPAAGVSTAALTVDQLYQPLTQRDPLKEATVYTDEHGPKAKGAVADITKTTFSVYNLSLAGITEYARSKEAMLTDPTTGAFYTLKAGRLLDSKKKQLPGVSGVIKGKQVILMTEDKKLHQLTLHQKE